MCDSDLLPAGFSDAPDAKHFRAALYVARVVREGEILAAARDFVRAVFHGDGAAAGERADVGLALFVESHIPRGDGTRPVVEDAVERAGPVGPVGLVIGKADVGAAFGPVRVLRRKCIVNLGHGGGLADIAVPGDAVDVLIGCRIAEFVDGATPQAVVVVEHPDLGRQAGLAQSGSEMLGRELHLLLLRPEAGGHVAFLLGVGFVLDRNGIDGDAFGLVALEEFLEVERIGTEAELAHGAAQHRLVGLHPSRRAPRRREQEQVGIDFARLAQHGQDVGLVVIDGKFLQLGIGLVALVEAVHVARIVARADAGAAHVEGHFAGREQVVHQRLALVVLHLAEHVAGRVGHGRAEAEDLLLGGARIENNGVRSRLSGGHPRRRLGFGMTLAAKGAPHAHRGRALRPGVNAARKR